jgi:lysozyme
MVRVRLRKGWPTLVGIVVAAVATIVALGYWFYDPGWRYEIRGVDVSHDQGEIDWLLLANDRTDFAYIRATDGVDGIDPRFDENWEQAQRVGLIVGAYHRFELCAPGNVQAGSFIRTVPVEVGTLPPAVDLSLEEACVEPPNPGSLRAELGSFIRALEDRYGTQVVVYAPPEVYAEYLADDPPDVIWWAGAALLEPWGAPDWTFWRYFSGRRDGVDGRVDRSAFRGTRFQFDDLLQR